MGSTFHYTYKIQKIIHSVDLFRIKLLQRGSKNGSMIIEMKNTRKRKELRTITPSKKRSKCF